MRLVARISYSLCPAERSEARGARQEILATSQGLCRDIKGGALGWLSLLLLVPAHVHAQTQTAASTQTAAATAPVRWSVTNGFVGTIRGGRVVHTLFDGEWLRFAYVESVIQF